MGEVLRGDCTDLSLAISRGDVTCQEVMSATLARIDAVNGRVNAIVSLRAHDALMQEAQAADLALAAAQGSGESLGWLHGIPLAIKDTVETKGLCSTMGSPIYADYIPDRDAGLVRRMKAAGGIVIGKTNTPELGLGSHTYNPVHGATHNPYDLRLSAGGSSGGAAAALATGMLSIADGSDVMGSLRNPAAWCNVYGFRPSWGRVPPEPGGDVYLHRLGTDGPMARSVRDIAKLLSILAADEPCMPRPNWNGGQILDLISAPVAGRRVAWLGNWGGAYAMEPGVENLISRELGVFSGMGVAVEELAPVHPATEIWEAWCDLRSFWMAAKLGPVYRERPDGFNAAAVWEIERGLKLTAMDVQRASEARTRWLKRALNLFEDYDALILPSAQLFAFDVTWEWPRQIAGCLMDTYHRWMEVVVPASLLGLPAISVPVGFDGQGRAMGMQIIGAPGRDLDVLQLAEAWHGATGWPQKRPPKV